MVPNSSFKFVLNFSLALMAVEVWPFCLLFTKWKLKTTALAHADIKWQNLRWYFTIKVNYFNKGSRYGSVVKWEKTIAQENLEKSLI